MLPAVLHNMAGTYCCMSEKNNVTGTVFDYNLFLQMEHFCVVAKMYIQYLKSLKLTPLLYTFVQCSFVVLLPIPNIASVWLTG